jgi:hypothetical protein
MHLPRVVLTRHPMGRPLGAAGDVGRQRHVLDVALDLASSATGPGTIIEVDGTFEPGSVP